MIRKKFQHVDYLIEPAGAFEADLVHSYWSLTNHSAEPQSFTVLADGCCKLLVRRQPAQPPQVRLVGLRTRPYETTLPAQSTVLGIRFKLLAAPHLFSARPSLDEAWPQPLLAPDLSAVLLTATSLPDLAAGVAQWAAAHPLAPPVQALFAALYVSPGAQMVGSLAAAAGWSPRQVNRYFQAQFGLPLKTYVGLLRSYAAAQSLRANQLHAVGPYCDQSHSIRDLKKHTGATPRQLHRHRDDRFIQLALPVAIAS